MFVVEVKGNQLLIKHDRNKWGLSNDLLMLIIAMQKLELLQNNIFIYLKIGFFVNRSFDLQ